MSAAYETAAPVPDSPVQAAPQPNVRTKSLRMVGLLTLLVAAWGGIVPYLGPTFGYSADGSASWTWNLAHGVLALAPGCIGVIAGLAMVSAGGRLAVGFGRMSLATAGLLALAAGGWFIVGPTAWPVLENTHAYFVGGTPLRVLEYVLGYSLGTGAIVAAGGAFAVGWSMRHQRRLARAVAVAPAPRHGLHLHRASRAQTTATPA
jgi:hypothetical protein